MRGSEAQRARASVRDKWYEKDVPKYPILERDRKKLSYDEGREKENWGDLAALARTGRPQRSFKRESYDEKDNRAKADILFERPTKTVKLMKSIDGTLRCEVKKLEASSGIASCIVIIHIDGTTKEEIVRVTKGKIYTIAPCFLQQDPIVESLEDVAHSGSVGRKKTSAPRARMALRVTPADAKKILALYGKRNVKKVVSGAIVDVRATECIGDNEATARGLLRNGGSPLQSTFRGGTSTLSTYNPLSGISVDTIRATTTVSGTDKDRKPAKQKLSRPSNTIQFNARRPNKSNTPGSDRYAKTFAGVLKEREGETETVPGTRPAPMSSSGPYKASHMEQALSMLGSQIVEVQRAFDTQSSIKGIKNKLREPVISSREATEVACKLCRVPVAGAGDLVRHFMTEQKDSKFLTFSDFTKLYAFCFFHFKPVEDSLSQVETSLMRFKTMTIAKLENLDDPVSDFTSSDEEEDYRRKERPSRKK
jgi:hypothetical protein|eukprot:g4296.t1